MTKDDQRRNKNSQLPQNPALVQAKMFDKIRPGNSPSRAIYQTPCHLMLVYIPQQLIHHHKKRVAQVTTSVTQKEILMTNVQNIGGKKSNIK